MLKLRIAAIIAAFITAFTFLSPNTAEAVTAVNPHPTTTTSSICIFDCWSFTASTHNVFRIPSKDGDTSPLYYVSPGKKSHTLVGGIPFYVPFGCDAKTSTFGEYWAHQGWHRFPHHYGTIKLRPASGSPFKDC